MTVQQFLNHVSNDPFYLLLYLGLLPFTALLFLLLAKNEGTKTPWKYAYSVLIYLSCIPGIFAFIFLVYRFVFENQQILNVEIYTQLLPIISMALTIFFIRKNVDLTYIPGFGKLSGLLMMILATFTLMWIFNKTNLLAITFIPIQYILIIFVVLFIAIKVGFDRVVAKKSK